MDARSSVLLVIEYDGTEFAGWQKQPSERTVQGVLEDALERICASHVRATAAGRTDAGVHARGQAVGIEPPLKWSTVDLRRALNAVLPPDVWVASTAAMRAGFHPRFSALSRLYTYHVGIDEGTRSPFRSRYEWDYGRHLDFAALLELASLLKGDMSFRAFAVQGTAPPDDNHVCTVHSATWRREPGQLVFEIAANRFMHRMVRFLVGTMVESVTGRARAGFADLLMANDNRAVSAPAPARGLFLERVDYPPELCLREDGV
jgi:tRNA pseudouridine38-40 synthase